MVKATFNALHRCFSPRAVAARRGKKVSEIISRRGEAGGGAAERARS
jgi:small subunit ribosomal protein S5